MASTNQSLERGLALIELVDAEKGGLGIREIARRMALSPTIVQRLVHTLVGSGFLMKDIETQKYCLGYRALSLGSSLLTDDNLISAAMPILSTVANQLDVNAYLSVRSDDRLVYVLTLQGSGPISIRSGMGASANFHSTAMGKALLAEEDPEWVRGFLKRSPLKALTRHTITDLDKFADELARVRAQGFALSMEENMPGVVAVGATVRNGHGLPVAGVSVAYAPSLQPEVVLANLIRRLITAANEISQSLGCPTAFLREVSAIQQVGGHAS